MSKAALSEKEIRQLATLLGSVFCYISNLRRKHLAAKAIQFPKLPPILTESLTINLLERGFLIPELKKTGYKFAFGGKDADIIGVKGSRKIKIEVKATANSAFQELSALDVTAHYLVWVHFSDHFMKWESCLRSKRLPIEFYVLKAPGRILSGRQKITLVKFKRLLKNKVTNRYLLKV